LQGGGKKGSCCFSLLRQAETRCEGGGEKKICAEKKKRKKKASTWKRGKAHDFKGKNVLWLKGKKKESVGREKKNKAAVNWVI